MTDAAISLCRLLTAPRSTDSLVSVDGERAVDWETFTLHVARLATVIAARGPGRWLLFTENSYTFAVGLLAIWQSRAVAVLAPNGQPGTLSELGRATHGLISERDRLAPGLDRVDAIHDAGPASWRWIDLDRTAPSLELFTSGSTGQRKAVPKTVANLEDEVAGLERQWGVLLRGREAFATVSHQHIYGLLFRILWPLTVGRTFHARTYLHPEEMVAPMARAGGCYLVASPTHLSRFKGFSGVERLAPQCQPIFSSGSPLDRATAVALQNAFGSAPFEVFGSTETGGIAWRRQNGGADALPWTPFAGVETEADPIDGLLRVRSPYVSADDGVFTLADRVEFLADGRFIAGPRADRVVKLGDKRLSLPDMEVALGEHGFVSQVALTVLDQAGGTRLGAAIVLTPSGREALARQGRRAVSQALLQTLEPYWDRVVLPRLWRYVGRLPTDPQGKVTVAGLRALFASPYDSAVVSPEVVDESITDGVWQRTLRVPETLGCLEGHFPGFPAVPGVAQIQWVMQIAHAMTGGDVVLERIEALKFKNILRPGELFHLSAEMSESGDRVAFRLWNETSLFSSGRCVLAPSRRGAS